jgi:Uma2 family endonuclease
MWLLGRNAMTALLDPPKNKKSSTALSDDVTEVKLPESYEVVFGEIVEVEPMSAYANFVANLLNEELVVYGRATKRGRPLVQIAYAIALSEDAARNRIPDVSFLTYETWPADRPVPFTGNPLPVVPDLAVEVVSPTNETETDTEKVDEYLRGGVRLVWLIIPRIKKVYVYQSLDSVKIVHENQTLDGGDVLPGFEVKVGTLFPPVGIPAT